LNSHHKCTIPVPGIQLGKSTNLPVSRETDCKNFTAASNKTFSSKQHDELREAEERVQQTKRSTDISQTITKILSKLMVHFMHKALSKNINIMC
jgi:hypothetical protein